MSIFALLTRFCNFHRSNFFSFFFFNDTATTEIYTLSLHDALPISSLLTCSAISAQKAFAIPASRSQRLRSEEHTSELQSRLHLVCRLLLEKKKIMKQLNIIECNYVVTGIHDTTVQKN